MYISKGKTGFQVIDFPLSILGCFIKPVPDSTLPTIVLNNFAESIVSGNWHGCSFGLEVSGSITLPRVGTDPRISQIEMTQDMLDNYEMVFENTGTLAVGDIDIDYWGNGSLISSQTNTPNLNKISLEGHPQNPNPVYIGFWLNNQAPPSGFKVILQPKTL